MCGWLQTRIICGISKTLSRVSGSSSESEQRALSEFRLFSSIQVIKPEFGEVSPAGADMIMMAVLKAYIPTGPTGGHCKQFPSLSPLPWTRIQTGSDPRLAVLNTGEQT